MKYSVSLAGATFEVEVDGDLVAVDGTLIDAHLAAVPGTPVHHLLLDARSWAVAAQRVGEEGDDGRAEPKRWVLHTGGERIEATVLDERLQGVATTAATPSVSSGGTVVAPMPGLVVRVAVTVGQRVEEGAGLVVVEAMKMENELRASRGGVVAAIHVMVGETVERGAKLVTLEATEPSG